jgi:hypothetical protein
MGLMAGFSVYWRQNMISGYGIETNRPGTTIDQDGNDTTI